MGVAQYVHPARDGDVRRYGERPGRCGDGYRLFQRRRGRFAAGRLLTQPVRSPRLLVSRLMAFVVSINEPPPMATKPSHSVSRANPLVVR
jgi:hypothetical protein